MTKKNLETSIDINAAPDEVWRMISDLKRMPEWSPQCRRMRLLGKLREGTFTVNLNRQGWKFWPTASKVVRFEPNQVIAFRTLTNNATWSFEIAPTASGSRLTERRLVPSTGTTWVSKMVAEHMLGGEDHFDTEMADGMNTTLTNIKAALERVASAETAR